MTGVIDYFFADLAIIVIICLSRLVRHYVPVFSAKACLLLSFGYSFVASFLASAPGLLGRPREQCLVCSSSKAHLIL